MTVLQLDAIVNSTSETMDDNSPMCQRIFARAGPGLKKEIYNEVKGICHALLPLLYTWLCCIINAIVLTHSCASSFVMISECRTGEVKTTQGHGLPARYIIHTVGPVYNTKYQTAAENTLHCCYRYIIYLLYTFEARDSKLPFNY